MQAGRAILVNGPSSSGKSMLCRALQLRLAELADGDPGAAFERVAFDDVVLLLPENLFPISYVRLQGREVDGLVSRTPHDGRAGWECVDESDAEGRHAGLRPRRPSLAEGKPSSLLATGQTDDTGWGSDGHVKAGATRTFVDNGDGTVTDLRTGLTWEKKSGDDSIHAWDRTFTWCGDANPFDEICDVAGTPMDGTAVTDFIATLNAGSGFAGHSDWRLPNLEELESIRRLGGVGAVATFEAFDDGCAPGCTVTTCSCTRPDLHWTSSTYRAFPYYAWTVEFRAGGVEAGDKTGRHLVRAVRGGL